MTYDFTNRTPEIDPDTFIADGAQIIGRVILGKGASIWHNCVLRGDINDIIVGEESNIQDNSVLHVSDHNAAIVGKGVTVGHNVVLHACNIGDNCLVGMGSVVMDGVIVPKNCIIGANSLISPGKTFPEGSLIIGTPAVVKRKLTVSEIEDIKHSAIKYRAVWEAYKRGGIPCYSGEREIRLPYNP